MNHDAVENLFGIEGLNIAWYGIIITFGMILGFMLALRRCKKTAKMAAKQEEFVAPDVKDGSIVLHKAFGEGAVTKIDKAQKHIRVTFGIGEKTFIFPDAFKQGFLKMKGE